MTLKNVRKETRLLIFFSSFSAILRLQRFIIFFFLQPRKAPTTRTKNSLQNLNFASSHLISSYNHSVAHDRNLLNSYHLFIELKLQGCKAGHSLKCTNKDSNYSQIKSLLIPRHLSCCNSFAFHLNQTDKIMSFKSTNSSALLPFLVSKLFAPLTENDVLQSQRG
jgi:hypothetical protein